MYDENQIEIPQSFLALFLDPGKTRPKAPREVVATRYELCEDLANMLSETAQATMLSLGLSEGEVLPRMAQGLTSEGAVVNPAEANWVMHRLAELLNCKWTPVE
jgi:hypothetical protein